VREGIPTLTSGLTTLNQKYKYISSLIEEHMTLEGNFILLFF